MTDVYWRDVDKFYDTEPSRSGYDMSYCLSVLL